MKIKDKRKYFNLFSKQQALFADLTHINVIILFSLGGIAFFLAYFFGYEPINFKNLPNYLMFLHPFYHIVSDENCILSTCNQGNIETYKFFFASMTLISIGGFYVAGMLAYYLKRFFTKFNKKLQNSTRKSIIAIKILYIMCSILFFILSIGAFGVGFNKASSIKFTKRDPKNEILYPKFNGFLPAEGNNNQIKYHNLSAYITFGGAMVFIVINFFLIRYLLRTIKKNLIFIIPQDLIPKEIDMNDITMESEKTIRFFEEVYDKCNKRNWDYLMLFAILGIIVLSFGLCGIANKPQLKEALIKYFTYPIIEAAECGFASCAPVPIMGLNWSEWLCVLILVVVIPCQVSIFKYIAILF